MGGCALLLAGCAVEQAAPPLDAVDGRETLAPVVEAACQWMFGCCSGNEIVYELGAFTTEPRSCADRLLDAVASGVPLELQQNGLSAEVADTLLLLSAAAEQGRISVVEAAVEACVSATVELGCSVSQKFGEEGRCVQTGAPLPGAMPCDLTEMFDGHQDEGDECAADFECTEGLRCVVSEGTGLCSPAAGAGDTCFSDAECEHSLVCDWTTGRCVEGSDVGGPCGFADPTVAEPGTETVRCAPDLFCDVTTSTCHREACRVGSPCDDSAAVPDSLCPPGSWCLGPQGKSTCRPPGGLGAPCQLGNHCISGGCGTRFRTCVVPAPNGAPCFYPVDCESHSCISQICQPSAPYGGPCDHASDCLDGVCSEGVCSALGGEGERCEDVECDADSGLRCARPDFVCRVFPFAGGVSCSHGSDCASGVCTDEECEAVLPIGATCLVSEIATPCGEGAFCQRQDGTHRGQCVELGRPGQPCVHARECWGECVVRYGRSMCDDTSAPGEAWCDGA